MVGEERSATGTCERSRPSTACRSRSSMTTPGSLVTRILGDGKRQRTRAFSELESHYLFTDRFGRPGKGNDKGKVEGLVGYARRNFLVPIPVFADFKALNAHLLEGCRKRLADRLRGHDDTIGQRLEHDLAAFQKPLPAPYDACDKKPGSVNLWQRTAGPYIGSCVDGAHGSWAFWFSACGPGASHVSGPFVRRS